MGSRKKDRLRAAQTESAFRFSVVSQVEALVSLGWSLATAVEQISSSPHLHPQHGLMSVKARTLYRWLKNWRDQEMAGLEPAQRSRGPPSIVLPDKLLDFFRRERKQDPRASVPELLRRAEVEGIIPSAKMIDRTTAWRAIQRMGLETRPRRSKRDADRRRFEQPNRMMLVIADGKHFRAGAARLRRVALFFMDDATRYGLGVMVTTSENAPDFLRGLWEVIRRHGLMVVIFLDRGPGFIANDTWRVIGNLPGVKLIHGAAQYPEGRGKIERLNRTLYERVLCSLDGAPDVDPSCESLRLRLEHALGIYSNEGHESLNGDTPAERWERDERPLRFPENEDVLRNHFFLTERRMVSADHIIRFDGAEYEVPYGVVPRSSIEVHRHVFDGTVAIIHRDKRIRLLPVDKNANAQNRSRARHVHPPEPHDAVPKTAATRLFDRDFAPVVGPDGGFTDEE